MFKKASKIFQNKFHLLEKSDSIETGTEIPAVYLAPFFYGRISRRAAEKILLKKSTKDGFFLLRESITPMGNFSLSMIHQKKCVHYSFVKQIDGQFMIADGIKCSDPLELVQYYKNNPGFVTGPEFPCNRNSNEEAIAFKGISYNDLHNYMKKVALNMRANLVRALGPLRETLMVHVLRLMHESLPWYHGEISREEAIDRLQQSGLEDGKFIVRCRVQGESYALTMSHDGNMRHYKISVLYGETYRIDDGPCFKALIILIDHYHNRRDGLVCHLTIPCCEPKHKAVYWENYKRLCYMYGDTDPAGVQEEPNYPLRKASGPLGTPSSPTQKQPDQDNSLQAIGGQIYEEPDDDVEEEPNSHTPLGKTLSQEEAQELEDVYIDIRTEVQTNKLKPEHVTLISKLGSGQFGEVMKGTCMLGNTKVPVAVKTLKSQVPEGEQEIQREAKLMKSLDHKHIVRMIGVCKAETIMLVMELAELGPLRKFLQVNKFEGLRQWHLLEMIIQICDGMQYLESKDVVHRDLATRNVLLLNEHFAKISDFGMSRMVDSDSEYYTAHGPGRWPLMWYAPECLYYHKFDCKSDVWSFGVTMWEILSYAARPYARMKVPQIVHFLELGHRMAKPKDCDPRIYEIMKACWEFSKERRPTFKKLMEQLEPLFREFRHLDL